jgi:hypothetical protein
VAAIGNGAAFRRGRDFAAWVGVVPRQYSTGGKQKLFGISKRGNVYLRRMLIHGARAVLFRVKYDTGGFGQWVHRLAQRAPRNKVVVAIASQRAAQVSGFTYVFFEVSAASARPFPCCFFHSDRVRGRQGFLGVKVMRSFLDGLPAILDKRLLGECRFVDGYVEYVLSFSDLPRKGSNAHALLPESGSDFAWRS